MDLTPVMAGRLRAHLVERQTRLVLESNQTGAPAGTLDLDPPTRAAVRLTAADGSWDVTHVEAVPRHRKAHYSVDDGRGVVVATVWPAGAEVRMDVPGGSVDWQAPSLRRGRLFRYQVEGLLVARPSWTTMGSGDPGRRPFTLDVTPALAARTDASLVLLLATWLTWQAVSTSAA